MKSIINVHEQIGTFCASALLSEVCASPKPGLVDLMNNGAHRDMNLFTFMESIAVIQPYFTKFAEVGCSLDSIGEDTLGKIRPLGIECEKSMFRATKGVNTHKGAIFSLGILAAAAGYCYVNLYDLSSDTVCNAAGIIARESVKDFLLPSDASDVTKGRELYAAYGITGIRGEAASGFQSVRKYALPVMRELFINGGCSENDIYLQVLLHLMTQVVDTNVISRCGIDAMEYVKNTARDALEAGGALSPEGREKLFKMDEEYIKRNISPGGCADLLSVAIVLYLLENLLLDDEYLS